MMTTTMTVSTITTTEKNLNDNFHVLYDTSTELKSKTWQKIQVFFFTHSIQIRCLF